MSDILKISKIDHFESRYCIECDSLCEYYEQGLSCRCGPPWETEELRDIDYPEKWVKVKVKQVIEEI